MLDHRWYHAELRASYEHSVRRPDRKFKIVVKLVENSIDRNRQTELAKSSCTSLTCAYFPFLTRRAVNSDIVSLDREMQVWRQR